MKKSRRTVKNIGIVKTAVAAMLLCALLLVGCTPAPKPVETDAPETNVPETDAPETDAPETNVPEISVPALVVPDEYRVAAKNIDISLGFAPEEHIFSPEYAEYAKVYVRERIAHALYAGYNVSSAEVTMMTVLNEGCAGGLSDVIYTMTVEYEICIWGEDNGVTWDGAITGENDGGVYLHVGKFNIDGFDFEMYKLSTEAEIDKRFDARSSDKYRKMALATLDEMKNSYERAEEYTPEDVIEREMEKMYPSEVDGDVYRVSSWKYSVLEDTDEVSDVICVEIVICTAEYTVADGQLTEEGVEYTHMDWMLTPTNRGYELFTWYGHEAGEEECDPALREDCRVRAEAYIIAQQSPEDMFELFYSSKYTPEAWIENNLYTDFGFREPVDVAELNDDELEEYMNEAYIAARDVFVLYDVNAGGLYGRMGYSSEQEHVQIGEYHYVNMENPVFTTFAEWESYIRGIFGETVADGLLSRDTYVEYDGGIYGLMGGRGTNIFWYEVGRGVTSRTDTEIVYTLTAEAREEFREESGLTEFTEYHRFVYSLTEDGWRWTEFYLWN